MSAAAAASGVSRRGSLKAPTGAEAAAVNTAAPAKAKGLNCAQKCKDNGAGVAASVLQMLLVAGGFAAVTFFVIQYKIKNGSCYTGLPAASIGLAGALGVLTLVAFIDLIMEAVGGDPEKTDNVAIRAWYFMKCSLMGWGLVLATMGWCLYELLRAGMFTAMRNGSTTETCNHLLYWGVGGVVAILAVVIVFYVFLVSIIICVTCGKKCAKDAQKKKDAEAGAAGAAKDGKAKEEGAFEKGFGKAWNSTLQFFKLQGLAKDEDEEAAAAAAAVVVADGAKAGKIPEEKQSLVAAAKGE